jgi:hypothetical protein
VKVYLDDGPKAGQEVDVRPNESYWTFIEQIPGMEAKISFTEETQPIDTVKRYQTGMYKRSPLRRPTPFGTQAIFIWQGWM